MSTASSASKPSSGWQPPSLEEMQAMLPQYRFEKLLGRGGMGAVYKAVQVSLDRPVAIKVLPGDLIDDDDAQFAERFKNEARTMAKLSHPGIVDVFDFGETKTGLLYIVMEFIEGTDIAQMIQSQGKLPEDYALSITAHVCDALAYAHQNGIVHRDIKPANILINMEGAIKVADFGLAKANDPGQSGITKTNMAMGTPDFVAPEAFIPGVPLDGRADLYAIGVMLYQMLTGEIPRGIWTLPGMKVGTDPRFDAIITKAMQTDREVRYQTATDIRRDLDTILTLPRSALIAQQQAAAEAAAQASREARQQEAAVVQAPRKGPQAQARAPQPVVKKSSSNGLIFGLAAIVIAAAGAFFIFGGGDTTKPGDTAATTSAPRADGDTPKQTAPPATGKTSTAFSNFVPTAVWRDAMSGAWPPGWTLVGTERHLTGTGLSMRQFPQTGPNAGIRARFRSQKKGQFFDLIQRMRPQEKGRRYVVTMWADDKLRGHLHTRLSQDQRRTLSNFSSQPEVGTNVEHSAELYAVGNRLTFFFDGQMLASAEDASFPDGHPAIYAGPGIEIISLELAELGGSAPVVIPAMPTAAATAASVTTPGAIDLLADLDVAKNTVAGDWKLVNGELVSNTMSADSEINLPTVNPPPEYDFRIRLTRSSGFQTQFRFASGPHKGVFITDGSAGDPVNKRAVQVKWAHDTRGVIIRPQPLLVDGRTHDLVIQVRKDSLAALVDGAEVLRSVGGISGLPQSPNASQASPFSLKVSRGKVTYHAIEIIPVNQPAAATTPAAASPAGTGAAMSAPSPAAPPPTNAAATFTQAGGMNTWKTANLLALVDVKRDVLPDTAATDENVWKHDGRTLAFTHLEKPGRIAAPVSLADTDDFEIELLWKKRLRATPNLSTFESGFLSIDVPVAANRWVRVDVAHAGDKVLVAGTRIGFTGPGSADGMRVIVRCQGKDQLTVTINGSVIGSVTGLREKAQDFGAHPSFKSETLSALYFAPGDHEILEWAARALAGTVTPLWDPAVANDPRIMQLESGYKTRHATDAQKPFETALASLNQSYITNGIGKARAAAQAKGALAEVLALNAEKALVEKDSDVPAEDAADTPESLKKLRATYRTARAKLVAERARKEEPLRAIYLRALEAYAFELKTAGKTEQAKQVNLMREMKASQTAADAPARTLAVQPPPPPAPSTPAPSADAPVAAATFLANNGGSCVAVKDGVRIEVKTAADVPTLPFEVVEIYYDTYNGASKTAKSSDFQALNGLRSLRRVIIRAPECKLLKDDAFAFLAGNEELDFIHLEGVPAVTDGVLKHLSGAKKLTTLGVQYAPGFTGEGLASMPFLPGLVNADFLRSGLNDKGVEALTACAQLQKLRITQGSATDTAFARLGSLPKLVDLRVDHTGFGDEAAAAIASAGILQYLDASFTEIGNNGLGKLEVLTSLTTLVISQTKVSDAAVARLQKALPNCKVTR